MKIEDLIEYLEKQNPEKEVMFTTYSCGGESIHPLEEDDIQRDMDGNLYIVAAYN